MDANERVQSFNFEVGIFFKSFKEFESQLKHNQDAKFIQMYRRSSWNCSVCKIDVHLYASIVCNGCLEWIRVITKLPNSEQSYKGKVKTHDYINRQNQSTTGKL